LEVTMVSFSRSGLRGRKKILIIHNQDFL